MENYELRESMGGFGSGRNRYATTPTVEECRHLSSDVFTDAIDAPDGATARLSWGEDGDTAAARIENTDNGEHADALWIHYVVDDGGEKREHQYRIPFDYTDCHFGGVRPWFLCPRCAERRGKLYRPIGRDRYACRECHDLAYTSSRVSGTHLEEPLWRYKQAFAKADAENRRPHPEGQPWRPERPKGTHRDTFEEDLADLRRARDEWDGAVLSGMKRYVDGDADQLPTTGE
jgi:hypothetical protein